MYTCVCLIHSNITIIISDHHFDIRQTNNTHVFRNPNNSPVINEAEYRASILSSLQTNQRLFMKASNRLCARFKEPPNCFSSRNINGELD